MKYQSSKVIMYVQQLDKLSFENIQALIKRIKSLEYIKRYALIVHDKDGGKDHLHVTFEFNKNISVNRIAKDIEESNEAQFEIMTKRGKTVQ